VFAGMHGTNAPREKVASERGALLHVMFTARFVERLEDEMQSRSEWSAQNEPYSVYESMLSERPDLTLYHPLHSVELRGSGQLADLGVMRDAAVARDAELDGLVDTDAHVFRAIDAAHRANDVHGNIVEMGGIVGRAVLLSQLLRPGEQLMSWDRRGGAINGIDGDVDIDLVTASLERRCRVAHVDGSQRYDAVRDDIAIALEFLVDGGILVVDQCHALPHSLVVAATVWSSVADGNLVPVVATEHRLYGCAGGRTGATPEWIQKVLSDHTLPVDHVQVAGHDVMVIASPDTFDEAHELREQLALIEGSRTWRLRNKLARLLPTRR
jgi:hypothetical protein